MANAIRNKFIALGFGARVSLVRAVRVLRALGRPRVRALDHVTVAVTDLAEARWFYCDVLGAAHLATIDAAALQRFGRPPAANHGEGAYHVSVLLGGDTRVDLFLQHAGQPPLRLGHPHLAFRVPPGELLGWKSRLEREGVPTEGPLQLGPPGHASLYFNDPFGNHLELVCMGFGADVPIRPPVMDGLGWSRRPG